MADPLGFAKFQCPWSATGSLRFDGRTIEMDAAVMDHDGRFGGVACIERVKNPATARSQSQHAISRA